MWSKRRSAVVLICFLMGCGSSFTPPNLGDDLTGDGDGDGDGDTGGDTGDGDGDGDGDTGDGDTGDGDTGDGDTGDGDTGDGDTGDGDTGDGDTGDGDTGDGDTGDGDTGDGDTGDGDTGDGDTGDGDTGDGDTGDGDTGDGDTGDGDTGDGDTGDGDTGDGDTGDGDTGDGDTGDGDTGDGDGDGDGPLPDGWHQARLTSFESYPTSDEECDEFSGCDYEGYFAAFSEQKSEQWVKDHHIAAVHSNDYDGYVFKTLRIRHDGNEIDAVVYDMCSDSDCEGCCTRNAAETGFLIDLESYTAKEFGVEDADVVEWTCLDC